MKTAGRGLVLHSVVVILAIVATAGAVTCIQVWMGSVCEWQSVAYATFSVLLAMVPPLWIENRMGKSAAGPLATVAWRMGILIPAVVLSWNKVEPARNCIQVTMLACYLISLPLESWLLIRQSRHSKDPRF